MAYDRALKVELLEPRINPSALITVTESSGTPNDNMLEFGNVHVGLSKSQTLTIINTGDAALDVSLMGTSDTDFSVTPDNGPASTDDYLLAPGTSKTITVTYSPFAAGPTLETVTITSNATNAPSYTLNLTGNATTGPIVVDLNNPLNFTDEDGDKVNVFILGPGQAVVTLSDPLGATGPIESIVTSGTGSSSTLAIKVCPLLPGQMGDQRIRVQSISNTAPNEALGTILGPGVQISDIGAPGGLGVSISGWVKSLTLDSVESDATISLGGGVLDRSTVKLGAVGFNVNFTCDATLNSLTDRLWEGGSISAPNIDLLTSNGRFGPDLFVDGNLGKLVITAKLSVGDPFQTGNVSLIDSSATGIIEVSGSVGTISIAGSYTGSGVTVGGDMSFFESAALDGDITVAGYINRIRINGSVAHGISIIGGGNVNQMTNITTGDILCDTQIIVGSTLQKLDVGFWFCPFGQGLLQAPRAIAVVGHGQWNPNVDIAGNLDSYINIGGEVTGTYNIGGNVKDFSVLQTFELTGTFAAELNVGGSLGKFRSADLDGNITVGGPLGSLITDDILDGVDIHAGGTVKTKTIITIGDVLGDTEIVLGTAINGMKVSSWDTGYLQTPSLGKMTVLGDLGIDANIAGSVAGIQLLNGNVTGNWAIGGKLTAFTAALGDFNGTIFAGSIDGLTFESITDSIIKSTGNIKCIYVDGDITNTTISGKACTSHIDIDGSLVDSKLLFGVNLGADGLLGGIGADADTVSFGAIAKISIGEDMLNSIIGAGYDAVTFNTPSPAKSSIKSLEIGGVMDIASLMGTGKIGPTFISGIKINTNADSRFDIG